MSSILIKRAVVVTMDEDNTILEDGSVYIKDDKIIYVGSTGDIPPEYMEAETVIDAKGKLLMPGLVDLHFHTSFSKGFYEETPLDVNLYEYWYPMIRNLTPEDAYWAALYSYGESIKYGTTTVNDMFRQMISCAEAAEEIGIRARLSDIQELNQLR